MGYAGVSRYKLNFEGSVHDNKTGTRFVTRKDVGILVGAGSVNIAILSVLETEIKAYGRLLCGFQLRSLIRELC